MKDFDRGETLELQVWIHLLQCLEHVSVVAEGQGRMQAADDVQFRDAESQRLLRLGHHLLGRELKTVLVAFLAREGAELAGEDAIVGIVDVEEILGSIFENFCIGK